MKEFTVTTKQVAHMTAQARAKELATRDSQDKMRKIIIRSHEDREDRGIEDRSNLEITKELIKSFEQYQNTSQVINTQYLKKQSVGNIGYPIQSNKTLQQVTMALEWIQQQQEDEVLHQIQQGQFYHKLQNTCSHYLPKIQSPSDTEFWGNENPSVSSLLLYGIINSREYSPNPGLLVGAAKSYHFLNPAVELPECVVQNYPFADSKTMMLFGEYQYGGQRDFGSNQYLFGPEDCSSSVGKATYLDTEKVNSMSTADMIKAYSNPDNKYHYSAVTELKGEVKQEQLNLIESGDIYLVESHTAIIATKPSCIGDSTTVQFNRDIEPGTIYKRAGGGTYDYNLIDMVEEGKDIYILRPQLEHLHESCTLEALINRIDEKYSILFPDGPEDKIGDCRIFFEDDISLIGL